MPQVSVVMPAYNVAPYLREAVESVVAQTYQDWELLLVNDGSTDETTQIARECARIDPRIRLIEQENRGLAGARNTALGAGRGEFFALLDSDDIWEPGFLAAQMQVFERHPDTDLVTGSARLLGGPNSGEPARPIVEGHPALTLEQMIADESAVFIMTTLRRRVTDALGGFDARKRRSEDWDLWLRAVAHGFVMRRNWQPLAWYRVREGSLSRNTAAMLKEMLHTLSNVRPLIAEGSAAHRAMEAQVARFTQALLLEEAKDALETGRYADAAAQLHELRRRGGGALVGLTAWLTEHAPQAAVAAYRLRGFRPRWMRA